MVRKPVSEEIRVRATFDRVAGKNVPWVSVVTEEFQGDCRVEPWSSVPCVQIRVIRDRSWVPNESKVTSWSEHPRIRQSCMRIANNVLRLPPNLLHNFNWIDSFGSGKGPGPPDCLHKVGLLKRKSHVCEHNSPKLKRPPPPSIHILPKKHLTPHILVLRSGIPVLVPQISSIKQVPIVCNSIEVSIRNADQTT